MHCQSCQKFPATVKVIEPVYHEDGSVEIRKLHLCAPCAKGAGVPVETIAPAKMVSMLGKILLKPVTQLVPPGKDAACPECGWTLRDFRQTSRFGCPKDYEVFQDFVNEVFERLHGTSEHHSSPVEADLARFRKDLAGAVAAEDYETAARLRDRISELERSLEEPGDSA